MSSDASPPTPNPAPNSTPNPTHKSPRYGGRGSLGVTSIGVYIPPPAEGPSPDGGDESPSSPDHSAGRCPDCGGVLINEWDTCGLIYGVICFPCGLFCCLRWRQKQCIVCRNIYQTDAC